MKRMLVAVTTVVALSSAYFIFLIVRESVVSAAAYRRFSVGSPRCSDHLAKCDTELTDRRRGTEYAATIERVDSFGALPSDLKMLRYRLTLREHGGTALRIEEFDFSERALPRYRTMLAKFVTPVGIGFYSQITNYWPTVLFPLLFPFGTALLSWTTLVAVMVKRLSGSTAAN